MVLVAHHSSALASRGNPLMVAVGLAWLATVCRSSLLEQVRQCVRHRSRGKQRSATHRMSLQHG
jgi:acetylornithine/succinyldiaminopimelate/putrescine aminotransferase